METPSSTKRVTRSQTLMALNKNSNIPISKKFEDSEKGMSKSRRRSGNQEHVNQERSALIDITNDSPIVGLAMGSLLETPSSAIAKQRSNKIKNISDRTPGSSSGEALLRGQVKTLLQKVEEEALLSKISLENRPFLNIQGFVSSPMALVAPTPANTPQIAANVNEYGSVNNYGSSESFTPMPVIEEQLNICQVASKIFDEKKQESLETQKSLNRSLLLDFSEKFEVTTYSSSECSSVLTNKSQRSSKTLIDDDSESNWSTQVNASIGDQDDDEEEKEKGCDDEEEEGLIDELCEEIGKMRVSEFKKGKHIRFVYNSDEDEIVQEEEVLHLRGLPTPKGKHLRFPIEEEDDEEHLEL